MVSKEPRLIHIRQMQCLSRGKDTLTLQVVCSKGTYIRTLASDIGEFLGCGAHLAKLRRTRNGLFATADTIPGEELFAGNTAGPLLAGRRIAVDAARELLAAETENY